MNCVYDKIAGCNIMKINLAIINSYVIIRMTIQFSSVIYSVSVITIQAPYNQSDNKLYKVSFGQRQNANGCSPTQCVVIYRGNYRAISCCASV